MPDTDGFALIRRDSGAALESARRLPAIAVTAYANPEDRVRALVAGYPESHPQAGRRHVLAAAIAAIAVRKLARRDPRATP